MASPLTRPNRFRRSSEVVRSHLLTAIVRSRERRSEPIATSFADGFLAREASQDVMAFIPEGDFYASGPVVMLVPERGIGIKGISSIHGVFMDLG